MKIKQERKVSFETYYQVVFTYITDDPALRGAGYGFASDKDGVVLAHTLNPTSRKNYLQCLTGSMWVMVGMQCEPNPHAKDSHGPDAYVNVLCTGRWEKLTLKREVKTYKERVIIPAVGECNQCGKDVELIGFTNTCNTCGTDYNMSGQQLGPRELWGEETGESLADILRY